MNDQLCAECGLPRPASEVWNVAYLHGARHIIKQLAQQWAYDVMQVRMKGYGKN